jgi:hypothetical protein
MIGHITYWLAAHGGPDGGPWFDAGVLLVLAGMWVGVVWSAVLCYRSWSWAWQKPQQPYGRRQAPRAAGGRRRPRA